ncbi:hypothetical protein TWF481_008596 [Arthrobotrys musiformis]|uniref:Uncharacterized protein n=1 Tax=Arthrobotrys musiformis TaxID=47236 RepID=A0AAV9W7L4_9PEZI
MSRAYPNYLGRGGRRSLSDVHLGRPGESPARGVRSPTRTVSLAAPGTGSHLPLGERAAAEFQQCRISTTRPTPWLEASNINDPLRTDLRRGDENQPIRPVGTIGLPEDESNAQIDLSGERRKENVAPITNQQLRADFASSTVNKPSEGQPARSNSQYPTSSETTVRMMIQDPTETSQSVYGDTGGSSHSLGLPLHEELLFNLQSMYGNMSSDLTSNLEILRAIEDAFDARYTAAFDVFYNTRRFFEAPSGTILDNASDKHPIGSGTVSGKSIYGVFINDSLFCDPAGNTRFQPPIAPNLPDMVSFHRRGLQSDTSGRASGSASDNIEIPRPRQTSESSSVVQQRVSSFEAPRPIHVEKKYQTSPSYQLLSTLKPVRGRSIKDQFEKKPDSCAGAVESGAANGGVWARFREYPQHALVTPPGPSSNDMSIAANYIPPLLDISDDSDSIHVGGFSPSSPHFLENLEGEESGSQEIYDAELALSSPDFSDPQIVTSTPLQSSGLCSPLIPQSISILGDSRSSNGLDSSLDVSANSNGTRNSMIFSTTGGPKSINSSRLNRIRDPTKPTEKIYDTTASVNSAASDDNKENIAPDEGRLDLPSPLPRNIRRRSVSSVLNFARGESSTQTMGVQFQGSLRRQNRGWQKRPLRLVKSALGPFGVKESKKAIPQNQLGIKKKRQSVLDLFKFSRPTDTASSTPTPGTPSFRVLPTVDSTSLPSEVDLPIRKHKSLLSTKLGRKKKPILAVPKYPKKDKSRGNLFGLFEFNKGSPKSSFVLHSDTKETTERKVSTGSNRTLSKMTRRFSMNVFPIFKRRIFSAPTDTRSLSPEPQVVIRERSISPPPQLELILPGSGL